MMMQRRRESYENYPQHDGKSNVNQTVYESLPATQSNKPQHRNKISKIININFCESVNTTSPATLHKT